MKRGRPPLPPDRRRHVRVTVSVRADVADAMFTYAHAKDTAISALVNRMFERFVERQRTLNCIPKTTLEVTGSR